VLSAVVLFLCAQAEVSLHSAETGSRLADVVAFLPIYAAAALSDGHNPEGMVFYGTVILEFLALGVLVDLVVVQIARRRKRKVESVGQ
jgi:hypothetical protein